MKTFSTLSIVFLMVSNFLNAQIINEEYGGDGVVAVDVALDYDQAFDGAVDYLNRAIIMARVYVGAEWHTGLFRMTPDGYPDTSFDGDGIAEYMDMEISNGMDVGPDGKIVVIGSSPGIDGSVDMVVFRVNEDGSVDDSFGDNGVQILSITPNTNEGAFEVRIQDDNKILVAGSNGDFLSAQHIIVRLNEDGSIDDTFADNGVFSPALQSTSEYVEQIELNGNGDIYYLASTTMGSEYSGIIGKLDYNGTPDPSFANNGFLNLLDEGYSIEPSSFYLFDDGDIEVTGMINGTYYSGCKLRFEATGDADTSYGVSGAVTISGASDVYTYYSFAQSDGKTVLMGLTDEFVLIRLNQDGSIDNTFGTAGFWYPSFTTTYDSAVAGAILAGDEMIVLGSSYTFTANLFFASVLLNDGNTVFEMDTQELKVFPNPCIRDFTIELDGNTWKTLEVIGQRGELVYVEQVSKQTGFMEINLPAYLANGTYQVLLKAEDGATKSTSLVIGN